MKFQIGKNGITDGVIESLKLAFKNNKVVRISLLKNAGEERSKIIESAEDLKKRLGGNYVYKIIGFTIILRRKAENR